ncbi:MAG: NAD(P)/FAD-dependent oxidoreductase [Clostridium sp.]|nr:NAD(P)/FAD-dependent oxidoreductase [Clostridium sp.]
MKDVVVLGAGPAGMMAAISASKKHDVTIIDRNEKVGKKLFITGKGRCNVTNNRDISEFFDFIPGNSTFLYSSLYTFTNRDTINFFENRNTPLKVERGERVFPVSDKSSDIIKALKNEMVNNNVKIILNTKISEIKIEGNKVTELITDKGESIKAKHFIICTGGLSYPQTGSTGDGYKFAKCAGHTIKALKPSLVPIEINEEYISSLQGLSLKNVELSLKLNNKTIYSEFGEMIFTHYGISGPIVLSASRFINSSKNIIASINLKPALTSEELDKRIQRDFKKVLNKDFKNSLNELLPQKIIPLIIELSGIDENKKVNSITKVERNKLINLIQNLSFTVKGTRPIAEAIITSGGVNIKEVDPSTLKSKFVSNLSFAGEILDLDGFTGGYNIQIALSTGYCAGISVD